MIRSLTIRHKNQKCKWQKYCHEFDEERPELIFQELLLRLANKINKITQVTIRYPTRKTHSLSTD